MTNPLDLNTDNMSRIERFNLLFPRKVFFSVPQAVSGFKSLLRFNDYLLFYEKSEEVKRRVFESTGFVIDGDLQSFEDLDSKECEKKLLKIKDPGLIPPKDQKESEKDREERLMREDQLKDSKKEKTKEEIL